MIDLTQVAEESQEPASPALGSPALKGMPRYNSDGAGGAHLYMPWWEHTKKNKDFPRGYHIEIGGGFGMPMLGSFSGAAGRHGGYGASLKAALREGYGTRLAHLRVPRRAAAEG